MYEDELTVFPSRRSRLLYAVIMFLHVKPNVQESANKWCMFNKNHHYYLVI